MKLIELDWNAPGGVAEVEVEYPDAPIMEFVNWLRRTQRWRDDIRAVEARLSRLNNALIDIRNARNLAAAQAAPTPPTPKVDRMAKARAAKAAKRKEMADAGTV